MLHITSRHNAFYKQLKRVLEAGDDRQAVLEGVHLCQDWLRHRGHPERAFFDQQLLQQSQELQALLEELDPGSVVMMDAALTGGLSPIARAQGVGFLIQRPMPVMPEVIDHDCIWLDRVQDPGNVGTLLRTAAAAGIRHAYLSTECAGAWSSRVLRGGQGAHFVMTLYEQVNLLEAHRRLGVPLYTTALTSDAVSLYKAMLDTPCAWVFGNEGQGVARELLTRADQHVMIPQDGAIESLNVAVAAGICLFEQRRQVMGG